MSILSREARVGLLMCGVGLLAACQTQAPGPAPSPSGSPAFDTVRTAPAARRTVADELKVSGNVTADPSLQGQIGAPVAGRLSEVMVYPGQPVFQGQALARLESPELTRAKAAHHDAELRLHLVSRTLELRRRQVRLGDAAMRPVEEARNEQASAQGELEISRSSLELARKKLERARDLRQHGIVPQQELEEAETAVQQAASRVQQAQRQSSVAERHRRREERLAASGALVATKLLEAENELAMAEEEVEHTGQVLRDLGLPEGPGGSLVLRASRTGVVTGSQAVLGQAVTADQALFEILDSSRLLLWVHVYEKDQARIHVGMPVEVEAEALPGKRFSGRISYIPPQVELPSRALRCRVVVENPNRQLKVGMAAQARISLAAPHPGVTVPPAAVLPGPCVYVKSDGKFVRRPVTSGVATTDWVEIRRGLQAGEEVVTAGADLLEAGQP